MDLVQVALVHVRWQEDVERLRLTDVGRTVGGQLYEPALVQLKGGLEAVLLVLGQEVEMLDGAFVDGDGAPSLLIVPAFFLQQVLEVLVTHGEGAGERLVRVGIGRYRLDAGRGPAADDGDGGRWRNRHLVGEALHDAELLGIGAGAALFGQRLAGGVGLLADLLEDLHVPDLRHDALKRDAALLQEGVETHDAQADRALAHGGIARASHGIGGLGNEVGQDVVEEAHDVLDEALLLFPLLIGFQVEGGKAADRGAVDAMMVDAGRQRDLAAEVRHLDAQTRQLVVFRDLPVHVVAIEDVGLAGLNARRQDTDPKTAG